MKGFYVTGSNIHDATSDRYGPFPGEPGMTYEFLRCYSADVEYPDNHLFLYSDVPGAGDTDAELRERDHWEDEEGDPRIDGWRRCSARAGTFAQPWGPFWTDLSIDSTEFPDDFTAWAPNDTRDQEGAEA